MKNSVGKIEKLSASSGSQFCTRKFELVWIWSCNISLERLWEEDDENKDIDLKLAHWLFLSPKKTYLVKMESVRCCCILCLLNMFICHRTQLKSACTICMSIFLEVLPYVLDYCIQYTYIVLGVLGLEARKKEEGEEGIKWWACEEGEIKCYSGCGELAVIVQDVRGVTVDENDGCSVPAHRHQHRHTD